MYISCFDAGEACGLVKERCSLESCIVLPADGFGSDASSLLVVKSSLSVKSRSMATSLKSIKSRGVVLALGSSSSLTEITLIPFCFPIYDSVRFMRCQASV